MLTSGDDITMKQLTLDEALSAQEGIAPECACFNCATRREGLSRTWRNDLYNDETFPCYTERPCGGCPDCRSSFCFCRDCAPAALDEDPDDLEKQEYPIGRSILDRELTW